MVLSRAENIECLIQKPKTPVIKPPMHRSIYLDSVKRAINAKKECRRTMGYDNIKVDPKQFLKKNTRKVIRPFVEKTVPDRCNKTTAVRPRYDYGVENARKLMAASAVNTKPKENFVRRNIIDVMRKVPPLPKHRSQDTRNGHVIDLERAGLEPTHVLKKNFGKIPAYLTKKHEAEEAAKVAEKKRIESIKPPHRLLSEDERNELLKGLKTNWAMMQEEFLRLPLMTDTLRNLKTRAKLEKQLAQLESDISMLERYKLTYVMNPDDCTSSSYTNNSQNVKSRC